MQKVRFYFSANNICELINKSKAPVDPEINDYEGQRCQWNMGGRIDPNVPHGIFRCPSNVLTLSTYNRYDYEKIKYTRHFDVVGYAL
jgi:hypothetical protein